MLKHLDLFSGIGGFALAADKVWPGGVSHIFCDNEPFAQEVLKKHWPQAEIYGDIRTLTANAERARQLQSKWSEQEKRERTGDIDILTGGFPCQPFSIAGRRAGTEDNRYLWPQMLRVIREFHPRWVIGENVGGLVTWSGGLVLEQVHADLEGEGYEVQAFIIPAVAVDAPHKRDRVWIVANASGERRQQKPGSAHGDEGTDEGRTAQDHHQLAGNDESNRKSYTDSTHEHDDRRRQKGRRRNESTDESGDVTDSGRERRSTRTNEGLRPEGKESERTHSSVGGWERHWFAVASELCRVDDGLPARMDRNPRLKGLGNAIVPQVAEEIMRAIKATEP